MFLSKIDLPNCLVVFFVVCPRKPAENASKRPRRGQTEQRLQQGNKVKSLDSAYDSAFDSDSDSDSVASEKQPFRRLPIFGT